MGDGMDRMLDDWGREELQRAATQAQPPGARFIEAVRDARERRGRGRHAVLWRVCATVGAAAVIGVAAWVAWPRSAPTETPTRVDDGPPTASDDASPARRVTLAALVNSNRDFDASRLSLPSTPGVAWARTTPALANQ